MTEVARKLQSGFSRRSFLQAGAAVGGGLMIGWYLPASGAADATPFAPNAFIRIDRKGMVTVISPKIEMGEGTYTSLPMLVAEELDVDMSNVLVDPSPPSDKLYGDPLQGGR